MWPDGSAHHALLLAAAPLTIHDCGKPIMSDSNATTDPGVWTQEAYATDEQLAVRIRTHEHYTQPQMNFPEWVLDKLTWRGAERVLDIGAGTGQYFDLVRQRAPQGHLLAGDLSLGMLGRARDHAAATGIAFVNLNAQHLPFADQTFDVVLANHMLYHVPDIAATVAEIKRVLRPTGCLIAATNSASTMEEFDTLARRACTLLGYPRQQFTHAHHRFTLENGTRQLARHFRAVARYDAPSALHFPEAGPVMEYLNSTRALRAPELPEDISWGDYMDVIEKQVRRLIRRDGELRVRKLAGVLIATTNGGFAGDYLSRLNASSNGPRSGVLF